MEQQHSGIKNSRIAMLIDGDNAQAALIDKMLVETTQYGVASIRRIYGDWTEAAMKQWKNVLLSHAIEPVQQFRYTVGKNATDSALIIDAMDLLYSRRINSFCIVSSDSDYTRLATRIRAEGMFVIGMGKRSTPYPFVAACDIFVYVENLGVEPESMPTASTKAEASTPIKTTPTPTTPREIADVFPLLLQAYQAAVQEDGWVLLSAMGNVLRQIRPDFDPRTYGFKQIGQIFRELPEVFEVNEATHQIRLKSGVR